MANKSVKRNSKGIGSARKRPDGTWEARCTINGKRRSFYSTKYSEVLKAMRDAQNDVISDIYTEPSRLTVGQWLDMWLEEYSKPVIKHSTYISRLDHINLHIKPLIGKTELQDLSAEDIQSFYNKLIAKGISPNYVAVINVSLNSALKQAVKLKYIANNPTEACVLPKKTKTEIAPLTEREITEFLKAIQGHRFEALFHVALFTGMRLGEILGLPWEAIDFINCTVTVKQQLCQHRRRGEKVYIGTTKNGKTRVLTVPPFIMEIFEGVRQKQRADQINLGMAWNNEFDLVFTDRMGKHLSNSSVERDFKKAVTAIGCPNTRFHDLRHTYAVTALQEGDDPKTLQHNLGHSTANFTMNVYAHVSEKMKNESAKRMQAYYQKLNE